MTYCYCYCPLCGRVSYQPGAQRPERLWTCEVCGARFWSLTVQAIDNRIGQAVIAEREACSALRTKGGES